MKTLLLTSFLVLTACETPSYLPKAIANLASLDFQSATTFCPAQGMTTRKYYIGHYGRFERISCHEDHMTQTGSIAYQPAFVGFKMKAGVKRSRSSGADLANSLEPVFAKIPEEFEAPIEEGNCKDDFCQFPIFSLEMSEGQGLCLHMGLYGWTKGSKEPSFQYMIKTSCLGV